MQDDPVEMMRAAQIRVGAIENISALVKGVTPTSRRIAGMGPSELANKLELMEGIYHQWLGVKVDLSGAVVETSWFTGIRRFILHRLARVPFKVFRAEIDLLVEACEKLRTDANAVGIQNQFYTDYMRMTEEQRKLHSFLEEHFRYDLAEAQTRNIPLSQLVQEILFREGVKKGRS